jgi:lipopolysaccharide export system ATP-binding protein
LASSRRTADACCSTNTTSDDPMYVRARKGVGYLPQEPSIFRGLTVEQNLLAILETLPISAAERRRRLADLLAELGLTHLAKSAAYTLSGGERRRAEITRALVMSPRFILSTSPSPASTPSPSPTSSRSSSS